MKKWEGSLFIAMGALVILTGAAHAGGGWVSSGGELFQLAKNPWFVKGTKGGATDVSYCVQVDQASFSATEAVVKSAVQTAFQYWKDEFSKGGQSTVGRPGFAALATQNFVYQAGCDERTDVRFLFGYGALTPAEIAYLQEPSKYVGVTVRTDYDLVQLRGKGFVYLSGDRGPNAYHNPGDLVDQAWGQSRLLEYALIHEVGHVMGLPHTGTGLMSEVFPQQLLHKRFSQFYLDNPLQAFLSPPLSFEVCTLSGGFHPGFFKISGPAACLSLAGSRADAGEIRWDVSLREKAGEPLKPLGTIRAALTQTSLLGARPSVVIHLPQGQGVFSLAEMMLNGYLLGPIYEEGSAKGAFRLNGSIDPSELQIELHPDSISMVGVVDGRPMPVLVYSPPSLLKMLFPMVSGPAGSGK